MAEPAPTPTPLQGEPLRVLVLAGGPDREREVSLRSGARVADALRRAGHDVRQADIGPEDLASLDEFARWPGDVIFPALHGAWGEGGGVQRILDDRGLRYVGVGSASADLCMDKHRTKLAVAGHGVSTPEAVLLAPGDRCPLAAPVVVKPPAEGSSIDVHVCHDQAAIDAALAQVRQRHPRVLVERFVAGAEVTVGVLGRLDGPGRQVLPLVRIQPASAFYDFAAKYDRDDTLYLLDHGLPDDVVRRTQEAAVTVHRTLGCRHLSRVDFIVDAAGEPWLLEINTMPGMTDHSLLPKAAAAVGLDMPALCDRLVRLAART